MEGCKVTRGTVLAATAGIVVAGSGALAGTAEQELMARFRLSSPDPRWLCVGEISAMTPMAPLGPTAP